MDKIEPISFGVVFFGLVILTTMLGMICIVRRQRKRLEEEKKWEKDKNKYKYRDLRY